MQPITQQHQEVTERDERIVESCPGGCGTDVERVIPAGTLTFIANAMRGMRLHCTPCAERMDAEEEAQRHGRERHERERNCDLPRELRGLGWESYETDRDGAAGALAAAQAWAAGTHEKRGLLLVGDVGVGKTRLAATALWAMLDRRSCRFVNVAELIVKVGAGFGDKDRAAALRILTGKGALVLDDLDKITPSMYVLSNLYTAIDGRIASGAPLIVTTNMKPGKLRQQLAKGAKSEDADQRQVAADAIVSRLLGHCTVHAITGDDHRRR